MCNSLISSGIPHSQFVNSHLFSFPDSRNMLNYTYVLSNKCKNYTILCRFAYNSHFRLIIHSMVLRNVMWLQLVLWVLTFLRVITSSLFDVVHGSMLLRVNNKSRN